MLTPFIATLGLAATALARTDLSGCTSTSAVYTDSLNAIYASIQWYDPDSGEVCEFLDCGGGRAPPKTNVPGCAGYRGTETYSPSFIQLETTSAETQLSVATTTTAEVATSTTAVVVTTTTAVSESSAGVSVTEAPTDVPSAAQTGTTTTTTTMEEGRAGAVGMRVSVVLGVAALVSMLM